MRYLSIAAALLLWTSAASAQTVINPTRLEFAPSPDHSVLLSDGSQKVAGYEARFYLPGAPSPFQAVPLGKPAPVGGLVSVSITAVIQALPFGQGYTCRVVAVGPTGEGVSGVSNPFEYAGAPGAPANVTVAR